MRELWIVDDDDDDDDDDVKVQNIQHGKEHFMYHKL